MDCRSDGLLSGRLQFCEVVKSEGRAPSVGVKFTKPPPNTPGAVYTFSLRQLWVNSALPNHDPFLGHEDAPIQRKPAHEWLDQYIIETIEEAQDHATQ